jgi:hypothetical protein
MPIRMASIKKTARKLESSCIADKNVNWCNHYGKQYGFSSKIKHRNPYDTAIPLDIQCIFKRIASRDCLDIYIAMAMEALLTKVKRQK